MDETSRAQKWASLVVMTIAIVAAGAWIVMHGADIQSAAAAHGFGPSTAYAWVGGTALVVAAAAGAAALFVCGLIQMSASVWGGGPFLAFIAAASLITAFAAPEVPGTIAYVEYHYLRSAGEKGLEAAREANVARIVQNNLDCNRDLDVLGFPDFLHPASLGAPHGLENARAKIKKARAILVVCLRNDNNRIRDFRKTVAALDLSEARKAEALSAVDDKAEPIRKRLYGVAYAIVDEAEAMLTWLAQRRAHWTTDADKLMFYDRKDLEAYRVRAIRLKALADEGKALSDTLNALDKDKTGYAVLIKNG
jgi:hypothetical protein